MDKNTKKDKAKKEPSKTTPTKKEEKELDKTLKDTFPASDSTAQY